MERPKVFILCGPPGVGKTYLGKLLSKYYGTPFIEGDNLLSPTMKAYIKQEKSFPPEMTQEITQKLIQRISRLNKKNGEIVIVPQALLKESDRQAVKKQYPEVEFVYVTCNKKLALERVQQRYNKKSASADELVSKSYARRIFQAFYDKGHAAHLATYPIIVNNGDVEHLWNQIEKVATYFFNKAQQDYADYLSDRAHSLLTDIPIRTNEDIYTVPGKKPVADALLSSCGIVNSTNYFFYPKVLRTSGTLLPQDTPSAHARINASLT